MPLFFYQTVLALMCVFCLGAGVIIVEDALSAHKSIRVRSAKARVGATISIVVVLFAIFFFSGNGT